MIILQYDMKGISNAGQQCSREWLYDAESAINDLTQTTTPFNLHQLIKVEHKLLCLHKKVMTKHP